MAGFLSPSGSVVGIGVGSPSPVRKSPRPKKQPRLDPSRVINADAIDQATLPPFCHASNHHAAWRPFAWSVRQAGGEARSRLAAASLHIDPPRACSPLPARYYRAELRAPWPPQCVRRAGIACADPSRSSARMSMASCTFSPCWRECTRRANARF